MKRAYFENIENPDSRLSLNLDEVIGHLAFNEQGLITVITQDAQSNEVLMLAWMNKQALQQTLSTRRMTYWSRSRQELWVKGETSGHIQELDSMAFDCDGDAILCKVKQTGAACHTGRANCFYLEVDIEQSKVNIAPQKK